MLVSSDLTTWRLLTATPIADGPTQMALDEAICQAVAERESPPTLRFYAWQPPCLSLGRAQPATQVDWDACQRDGVDVVRRSTGGRAILHTDELTYAVIAPKSEPRLAGGLIASYYKLSQALLAGLTRLGLQASHSNTHPPDRSQSANPVCFQVPSSHEIITADGRKLLGSAQMRTRDIVLQHGTLPLQGDIARICDYLLDTPHRERIYARAATLKTALGRQVSWEEVAGALIIGFGEELDLHLESGQLTVYERELAGHLRAVKYTSPEWTLKDH